MIAFTALEVQAYEKEELVLPLMREFKECGMNGSLTIHFNCGKVQKLDIHKVV